MPTFYHTPPRVSMVLQKNKTTLVSKGWFIVIRLVLRLLFWLPLREKIFDEQQYFS